MKNDERRLKIIELLSNAAEPISGSRLAKELGVSRQVIVNDVALIRATRPEIISTNSGYVILHSESRRRIFKTRHTDEETEDELTAIVDLGGAVLDVFVEHKVYGTITAPLNIHSKREVQKFIEDMNSGVSTPLKNITQGYHYHTVEAHNTETLDEIEKALKDKGYLIEALKATPIYGPKMYR